MCLPQPPSPLPLTTLAEDEDWGGDLELSEIDELGTAQLSMSWLHSLSMPEPGWHSCLVATLTG